MQTPQQGAGRAVESGVSVIGDRLARHFGQDHHLVPFLDRAVGGDDLPHDGLSVVPREVGAQAARLAGIVAFPIAKGDLAG